MTVTLDPSITPKLDPRTEVGVNILKLPPRAELAASLGCDPSDAAVLKLAAKIAGPGKKSDIVVFDHQPWHRVNGELLPHPEAHTVDGETILQISFRQQERPVWWSAERFTILDIQPSAHHGTPAAGVPRNPFEATPFPYRADENPVGLTMLYVVRATPIVARSVGTTYKIVFNIGEDIDPDMSCNP